MKTTLDIPDGLLQQAREVARAQGTTLRALVTEGLRAEVAARTTAGEREAFVPPVFDGEPGVQPGVDLADWDAVRETIYGRWGG